MRLIDADALIQVLCVNMDTGQQFHRATHCVDVMPTVEAVPVIRCKDCEWYINNIQKSDGTEDRRYKRSWCEIHHVETHDMGFCHWAYRRQDNEVD